MVMATAVMHDLRAFEMLLDILAQCTAERPASAEQPAQSSDELPASLMKCIRDSKEHVVSTLSQRGV